MAIKFYLDHHIPAAVEDGLRTRGVDILTTRDDGLREADDAVLLDRATALGRAMVTQDSDFLTIAANHLSAGKIFAGVIYAHPLRNTIGQMIDDLVLLSTAGTKSDVENNVVYLPLS